MSRVRGRIALAAAAIAIGAGALAVALAPGPRQPPAPRPGPRPALLLLTSLPIIFNEDFGLEGGGSPALEALQSRYQVIPISVADEVELDKGRLLLMAQPFAQTPENLVVLDQWVRKGGRLLLLADPLLEWPSKRPLGDLTRPPPMFTDTGLLAHWGLRLEAPDRRGTSLQRVGKYSVATASPGRLSGACDVRDGGLEAHCRIGRGEAVVIADADFLNTDALQNAAQNLDALLEQLASLEHP